MKSREPKGQKGRSDGFSFVVQKHAARRLHYDFRLELDGVLLSWAVPKGPSSNPHVKRLAMQTEDHPVEYGGFEGVIPKGEYGGGSVLVWDRGTWVPEGDPREAYRRGRLTFELRGKKLHGGFHLVRTGRASEKRGERRWLLMKRNDDEAEPGSDAAIVDDLPKSVLTGRGIEEVGQQKADAQKPKKTKTRPAARTKTPRRAVPRRTTHHSLPAFVAPELATLVDAAPDGDGWLHEIKLDGYRILARVEGDDVRLLSRRGNDWAARLPSVAKAVAALGLTDTMLDGELVVLGENGISNFQRLQNSMEAGKDEACTYFVFDVLFANGEDVRAKALAERKDILTTLLKGRVGKNKTTRIRLNEHVAGGGATFFEHACKLGLEGIVSKRASAPYESRRTHSWLKVKCLSQQEFVVGGYTDPAGSRSHFGALLLGVQGGPGLEYAGKVGTGFSEQSLREIAKRLGPLAREEPPFVNPPRGYEARGVHWLEPALVAEVAFAERTDDGHVRHATFLGLRDDKTPKEVHAERATPEERLEVDPSRIRLTHPERVLYPEQGLTKADLALYYAHVARWMLPHLVERPLTLLRCPEGAGKECFFQKHPTAGTPDAVGRFPIAEKRGKADYMVVRDAEGLVGLVQVGALEIHTWGSRIDAVEKPDQLVFDLDPDERLPWTPVVEAATTLRERLGKLGLTAFVKTTGGKGLHVVVPVTPEADWDAAKAFSKKVVDAMVKDEPAKYVATMTKEKRKGKIFLDYLRNSRGATSVCAYSTRARPDAPVSTPLGWCELTPTERPSPFDMQTVQDRVARLRADPWADFDAARARIR